MIKYHKIHDILSKKVNSFKYESDLNWIPFTKINVKVLNLWRNIIWNKDYSFSFIEQLVDTKFSISDITNNKWLTIKIIKSINSKNVSKFLSPINIKIIWVKNWILEVIITDIANRIKDSIKK
jgi:hypothetical protein